MTTATESKVVRDRIIDKIFSGKVQPGSRLIERELAEELGVSRIPVREALNQMVAQGVLIGGQKRRSVRVRKYTADEIRQLFEFREMIEAGAARAAAQNADARSVAALQTICRKMSAEVERARFNDTWTDLDHAFHDQIAEASGNEWIAATLHMLLRQCHYVFYRLRLQLLSMLSDQAIAQRKARVIKAHNAVLERIKARDPDGAERAMRLHIRQSYKNNIQPDDATEVA